MEDEMETRAYHGTQYGGFDQFSEEIQPDFGMFFTDDKQIAIGYADTRDDYDGQHEDEEFYPCIYDVKLHIENPMIVDAQGAGWDDINGLTSRDYALTAKQHGYDGLIVKNVIDCGPFATSLYEATTYVVFNSNQIEIL
jgi:hypothetical protein